MKISREKLALFLWSFHVQFGHLKRINLRYPLVILLSILCVPIFATEHPIVKAIFVDNKLSPIQDNVIQLSTSEQLILVFSKWPDESALYYQLTEKDDAFKTEQLPVAVYTSLKAGTYQFQSYLKSGDGIQDAPPIKVVVKGSFMSKWWFIPLLVIYLLLLFGGALYFILLSNFRNREKLAELRNDWTNKLHNDIGGDLSSVALRLQTLKRKLEPLDPSVKERVVKTYTILESIQKKLRFVFDLVDPKKDSLQVMLNDVKDFAKENLALQNIQFQYTNTLPTDLESKLDISRVNKLYLAMKEVINNCVKYSKAQLVSMQISTSKKGLHVLITDDGKGFDVKAVSSGNGLNNLKQFSQEGFMDIQIDSQVGKGTTANILVPDI